MPCKNVNVSFGSYLETIFSALGSVVNFVFPFFQKSSFSLIIRIDKWEIKHKTHAPDIARGELNLFKCQSLFLSLSHKVFEQTD